MWMHGTTQLPYGADPGVLLYLLPLWLLWLLCPYAHIDSSIEWILNDGFAQGRRFGTELVWTNGPLGLLWADPFHPDTLTWALVQRLPFADHLLYVRSRALCDLSAAWTERR